RAGSLKITMTGRPATAREGHIVAQFTYGPVEFYLFALDGEKPAPGVVEALRDLVEKGIVRLLDLILVTKAENGDLTVVEIDENPEDHGFEGVEFAAIGLAGDEDIDDLAPLIPAGTTAAIVVLELAWAKQLAERLASSGAEVLSVERVPAPVVNALVDSFDE